MSKVLCQLFIVSLVEIVGSNNVTINTVNPGLIKGTSLACEVKGAIILLAKAFFRPRRQLLCCVLQALTPLGCKHL